MAMFFFRLPHPILCQACQQGNLEAVKIILEAGANPNHFDVNKIAPIHYGAGKIEILKLLHEKGGDINLFDLIRKPHCFMP